MPGDRASDEARELPGAVLFACSMNAVRSPMAAAILRHLAGRKVYVASAGVRAGEPDPFVIAVMDEIGIDVSEHVPHTIDQLHDTSFDIVVSLSPEAHHQALELTRTMAVDVVYWPTMDPTIIQGSREQILDAYRACRDNLFKRIKERFPVPGAPPA
ncbi:MAG: arsenate reductase ArsC [Hyphomicrobiaceae bacterium]